MKRFIYASILLVLFVASGQAQDFAVVNGATYKPNWPVAAGSWVSAFGTFANVAETPATSLPLPKTLGGVTVTVAGVQAPLQIVTPSQINFVVPYGTAPGLHPVVVTGPGGTLNGTIRVINAAPGIFKDLADTSPLPQGAVLNQDNSYNGQNRPAIRGQVIQIFATGHSALAQQLADGAAAPATPATTQAAPQVFIGGVECTVEFSGLTPGYAALWQVNARVPNLSFLSGKLPLQIFMNGVDSNEVTIYVAQ